MADFKTYPQTSSSRRKIHAMMIWSIGASGDRPSVRPSTARPTVSALQRSSRVPVGSVGSPSGRFGPVLNLPSTAERGAEMRTQGFLLSAQERVSFETRCFLLPSRWHLLTPIRVFSTQSSPVDIASAPRSQHAKKKKRKHDFFHPGKELWLCLVGKRPSMDGPWSGSSASDD